MVTRSLPESCSCLTPLYRGELFAIDDWRCAGHDSHAPEWSADDRVVVTRRGVWELEIARDARHADSLTATCWNRHREFRVRHPIGGKDQCTVFRLTDAGRLALRDVVRRKESHPTFASRTRAMDGTSYLMHRTAFERARPGPGRTDALAIEEPALALLRTMMVDLDPREEPDCVTRASCFVADTRELVARDFREPLTLERIAREVRCSPFHLSRLFQRATGKTIHRTVMQLRLREGLERLLDEPANLAAIALDVGFASHSHFTDAFRAEFGCSPREARAKVRA